MLAMIADFLFMVVIFGAAFALLSRGRRKAPEGERSPAREISDEPGRGDDVTTPRPANRAWLAPLAAGISLLFPGAGHFLIHAWLRGAIWFAGWLVIGALSQARHTPFVLVLMVVVAIDAYLTARWSAPPGGTSEPGTSNRMKGR